MRIDRHPAARLRALLPALLLAPLSIPLAASATTAAAPTPFSAQYRVLRDGDAIGTATLSLARDGAGYVFSNVTKGNAGLAALLGLDVSESSRFDWRSGAPLDLDYRYRMRSAFKTITRGARFDWSAGRITVDNGKSQAQYAAAPGTVDRNLAVLLLAQRVAAGARGAVVVPVAMNDHISQQHYAIAAAPVTVRVPAGRYQAYAVQRSDADNGLRAWYAPPLLAPVRMEQRDGKGTVYLLELAQAPR